MLRKRGLLSLRAVNSLKNVFGANQPAWLTLVKASTVKVSFTTAVTLTGRLVGSCGSFCAVTSIGGNVVVSGGVCAAAAGTKDTMDTKDTKDTKEVRAELATSFRCRARDLMIGIREFSHIFWCAYDHQ